MEFEIITAVIQSGGISVIGYFLWSMMRDIKSVRNDMNVMSVSFNKKLYAEDGRLIYRRLDDCKEQMCAHANDIDNIGMKTHKMEADVMRLQMQVATMLEQLKKEDKL